MSTSEKKNKRITVSGLRSALKMFRYIKPYSTYFYSALFILVIGSFIMMAIMGIPGEMVGEATGQLGGNKYFDFDFDLNTWGWIMFGLLALRAVLSFIQTILFAHVSEKGMADVRKDVYKKLITQTMGYFETHRVGDLTSRITTDVGQLQNVFSITLAEFIRQTMTLIIGITILAFLMPRLFLIMLLTIPVVVVLAMVFGRYIRKLSKKRQALLADTNVIVEETFQNFAAVKAFANEGFELNRYGQSIKKVIDISLSFARVRGTFFAFIIMLLFGSILFILWRGAFMVQNGEMDAGTLLSFVIYTVMIGGAIASLGNLYTTIAGALGATERVKEILERDQEVIIDDEFEPVQLHGNILFENVHFEYPTRPEFPVLNGVNIKINSGDKVAFVGQSGSGKSTLVRLLMGFYELQDGAIYVDGKDIQKYNIGAYRENLAIVPQEVILFGGTIKENLLYGKPDASDQELKEAAIQANCWDFISAFPDGMETIVGERGIKLSGGQKQRVAIARAILKNPSILLLDEATSSLDAESEKVVQDAMNVLMEGRTSIIIAHRLSTIKDVDQIYVIDNGKVAEQGTHHELFEKEDGIYKNLARLQFEIEHA